MTSKIAITFLDRSNEKSSVEVNLPTAAAATVEGIIDEAQYANAGTLGALIAALSLATPIAYQVIATSGKTAQTLPGNVFAQREIAVQVAYTDNVTGKMYHFSVPAPDWTNLAAAGSDLVDTTKAVWTAFKAKFESVCVSPEGNAVTVTGGRLVGRNR